MHLLSCSAKLYYLFFCLAVLYALEFSLAMASRVGKQPPRSPPLDADAQEDLDLRVPQQDHHSLAMAEQLSSPEASSPLGHLTVNHVEEIVNAALDM